MTMRISLVLAYLLVANPRYQTPREKQARWDAGWNKLRATFGGRLALAPGERIVPREGEE